MTIQRPKGTQDILPGNIEKWHFIENTIRKICKEYGFQEIRTPIFEQTDLFQRGVGETTDIVNKEMYTFQDKGNRSMTLRPEGTASVCRAYVENKMHGLPQPIKLYYIGSMFRYENTQAGRFRQFNQFGVEVFGAEDPIADAEVIGFVWDLFKRLGLDDLEVHINSVGCSSCREKYKLELQRYLRPQNDKLCHDCKSRFERNPMRILDCKNPYCQEIINNTPTIDQYLCNECKNHFVKLQDYLEAIGVTYKIDPKMVRGLDYYQKTAFEVLAKGIGAQSAICGGGRYDGLVEQLGGQYTPGIGFALGLERVLTVLENQNINLTEDKKKLFAIISLGEKAQKEALVIASELRQNGVQVFLDLLGKSLKTQLKIANRLEADYALIIGDEEIDKDIVIVRNMKDSNQSEISRKDIITDIQKKN
ncbi:MAG: histidine--tRNA ligase [Eubacteriales bacterium]